MADDFQADRALERLRSMHQTVEKLRSQLKDLELESYGVARSIRGDRDALPAHGADGLSSKFS
jgi:hypothetical protein